MQKKLLSVTNIAIILAAFIVLLKPELAQAHELPRALFAQPGVYGVTTQNPLNALLTPVPQDRWNVLYQQAPETSVLAGIQFNNDLHLYVTQADSALVSTMSAVNAPEPVAPQATVAAQTKPVAKTATNSAVITIDKSEQPATKAAVPTSTPTPTVKPTPVAKATPVALEPSALDALFEKYGQEYGLSPSMLKHIAKCESGLRPEALSSNGLYGGLFQFVSGTWSGNRKAMGLDPDPSLRFNAEEAIKTAAFKIARDGIGAWPVCGRKATASL